MIARILVTKDEKLLNAIDTIFDSKGMFDQNYFRKDMKLKSVLALLFLSSFLASCNIDERPVLGPSVTLIEMEAEGGETEVVLTGEGWSVAEIVNSNGDVNISGDSYSPDDQLIRENRPLTLDGLGRMEAQWINKGFRIVRETDSTMKVILEENTSGEEFSFVIILQSGDRQKEVTVNQKTSQGYRLDGISYRLMEGDGDSLFYSRSSIVIHHIQTPSEFSFSPFNGINVSNQSYFEGMPYHQSFWQEDNPILVKVPAGIYDNEIYFNGEELQYSSISTTRPHGFEDIMETVVVPAGTTHTYAEVEYRKRTLSYTLVLTNNRTEERKTIEGKWVEIAPTGKYNVKTETAS